MSTFGRQTLAIDAAVVAAEGEGIVHVMGPREARGELLPTERMCDAPDAGQRIVYHVHVVSMPGGRHACTDCGEATSEETGERNDAPMGPRLDS